MDRYIRQCLETHVVPYAPFVGENFLFMHGNDRPDTARIVTNYLDTIEIPHLEWPAPSLDMNPMGVWDTLGRNVKKRQPLPETIQKLRIELHEEGDICRKKRFSMLLKACLGVSKHFAGVGG
jgi:hypothetical protein